MKYLIFLYLNDTMVIMVMVIISNSNLFILVNSSNEDKPPRREDSIILKYEVFLFKSILTEVIIIISIMVLNNKNKSIYMLIY